MTARLERAAEVLADRVRRLRRVVVDGTAPNAHPGDRDSYLLAWEAVDRALSDVVAALPDPAVPPVYGRADPVYATFPLLGMRKVPGRWRPVVTVAATGQPHPGKPGWGEARTEQRADGAAIALGGLLVRLGLVSAGHHCAPFPQGWGEHPFGTQG